MFKRKDSDFWWTCIRHNGGKIQKNLKTSNRKLAQAIEAKIRTEIVEGSYFEKLIGRNKTFKDMMDKFIAEHAPNVSNHMQRGYETKLRKHLIPFFGSSNLLSISPKMISRYKVSRRGEGVKPATINRELAMLEEKTISGSNLETIKKRIKFLETYCPNDVFIEILKLHFSINESEEDSEKDKVKFRTLL